MPFPAAELTRHHMENYLRLAMKGRGGGREEPLKAAWRDGLHPISLKQVLSATEARARLQAKKRAEFYSHN